MEPRDFLKLAEHLVVAQNAGSAHYRTAIGRAYYASFNLASQVLANLGFPLAKNANGHQQAVRLLQQSADDVLEVVGGLLGDLHADRIKADYDLQRNDVEKMKAAQVAVEIAASIYADVDAFLADQHRKLAVTKAVRPIYTMLTVKS
jgi:hypothetical protein